jgi:hypothetical protein
VRCVAEFPSMGSRAPPAATGCPAGRAVVACPDGRDPRHCARPTGRARSRPARPRDVPGRCATAANRRDETPITGIEPRGTVDNTAHSSRFYFRRTLHESGQRCEIASSQVRHSMDSVSSIVSPCLLITWLSSSYPSAKFSLAVTANRNALTQCWCTVATRSLGDV